MKPCTFLIPPEFHEALKIAAKNDGVTMSLYLTNLMRKEWQWPLESLPAGNSYRHGGSDGVPAIRKTT